jgi:TRAP-type C4-dicarboxylate transport system permease small subunit
MRRFLDVLYDLAGYAAACALLLIFGLVALQIIARLYDGALRMLGFQAAGLIVPSIAEICGFLLAAASFLALAKTLTSFSHIRVGMLVDRFPPKPRRCTEVAVGAAASLIAAYATVALARFTWKSFSFNDVSYGIVPVPLWLPQAVMTLGLAILAVALVDLTVRVARGELILRSGPEQ